MVGTQRIDEVDDDVGPRFRRAGPIRDVTVGFVGAALTGRDSSRSSNRSCGRTSVTPASPVALALLGIKEIRTGVLPVAGNSISTGPVTGNRVYRRRGRAAPAASISTRSTTSSASPQARI